MKRVLLPVLAVAGLICLPGIALAAKCYTPAEAEAEQGIRIHSELMVIGLNCNHMGERYGQPLYAMYRQFTADHGKLFAAYESQLLKFFKANGDKDPVASLNTMRTSFANKISNDAAATRPDIFCSRYAPRILKTAKMTDDDVRKWAATTYSEHPVTYPVCAAEIKAK